MKTITAMLLLLCAFGFAGGCDQADAAVTPPPQGWGYAYQDAALDYWGGALPVACTTMDMEWDVQALVPMGRGGQATRPVQLGTHCVLDIAPLQGVGLYARCIVYAHEYGHTLGMGHVSDASMVMYEGMLGSQTVDQPCRELVERAHDGQWG